MLTATHSIGSTLRTSRIHAGRSQQWVADKLGVSRQTVIAWEAGMQLPSEINRNRVGQLLGMGAHEIAKGAPVIPMHGLPQAAREFVAEFTVGLVRGGCTDLEVDEARTVLNAPHLTAYLAGGATRAAALIPVQVIAALRAVADGAILPVLRRRGRLV